MKKDINYPMIFLAALIAFIVFAVVLTIVSDVNDRNTLKESGTSAEVPIVEKYDKLELVGKIWTRRYYIKTELPNGEITKARIQRSEYNELEVGNMLNVCYHNDISRINFENCAN